MRLTTILAVPAAALLLASCATADPSDPATAGPAPSGTAMATAAPEESSTATSDPAETEASGGDDAQNAFAFTAETVDGDTFDGLSIDDTDVVLWFWAPWCPTCQLQSKTINEALPMMPEGVPMIGIAGLSDDLGYMQEFVEVTGVDGMTHVADLDGTIYERFGITQQSTLVFINDTGDATLLGSGATAEEIVAEAQKLADS